MKNKSNKDIYEAFLLSYIEDLEGLYEYESFYVYGPLTDKYWEYCPRILICNLEPYDNRDGIIKVDINLYKEWMNCKTGKTTALLIKQLINRINYENGLNDKELLYYMENVAYMNFRVTSGKQVNADTKGINDDVCNLEEYISDQIKKLVPHIIIIGGQVGRKIFNKLFKSDLKFKETKVFNSWIVCSLTHPSRRAIEDYNKATYQIVECWRDFIDSSNS